MARPVEVRSLTAQVCDELRDPLVVHVKTLVRGFPTHPTRTRWHKVLEVGFSGVYSGQVLTNCGRFCSWFVFSVEEVDEETESIPKNRGGEKNSREERDNLHMDGALRPTNMLFTVHLVGISSVHLQQG